MKPLSFVIVGSGWRAMFYVRIALRYPQCFKLCYLLCRTPEKEERIHREYGISVTTEARLCEDARPDFVVVAVDRASKFAVTKQWLGKGFAVLSETPAALTVDELEELWALRQNGARLQIAEQYIRYPLIAAGLRAIEQGLLGDPYAVELSLAHDYHAASLIRHMLRCGTDTPDRPFPAMKIWGKAYDFPVEETGSRYGSITDGSVKQRRRVRLTLEFDNGKAAFYDFDGVQYHSAIRARHINVQGQRGEWNDTVLRYVDAAHRPVRRELKAWLDPSYEVLQTRRPLELSRDWRPEVHILSSYYTSGLCFPPYYTAVCPVCGKTAYGIYIGLVVSTGHPLPDTKGFLALYATGRHPGTMADEYDVCLHRLHPIGVLSICLLPSSQTICLWPDLSGRISSRFWRNLDQVQDNRRPKRTLFGGNGYACFLGSFRRVGIVPNYLTPQEGRKISGFPIKSLFLHLPYSHFLLAGLCASWTPSHWWTCTADGPFDVRVDYFLLLYRVCPYGQWLSIQKAIQKAKAEAETGSGCYISPQTTWLDEKELAERFIGETVALIRVHEIFCDALENEEK